MSHVNKRVLVALTLSFMTSMAMAQEGMTPAAAGEAPMPLGAAQQGDASLDVPGAELQAAVGRVSVPGGNPAVALSPEEAEFVARQASLMQEFELRRLERQSLDEEVKIQDLRAKLQGAGGGEAHHAPRGGPRGAGRPRGGGPVRRVRRRGSGRGRGLPLVRTPTAAGVPMRGAPRGGVAVLPGVPGPGSDIAGPMTRGAGRTIRAAVPT